AKFDAIVRPIIKRPRGAFAIIVLVLLATLLVAAFALLGRGQNSNGSSLPVGIEPWPAHESNPLNLTLQLSRTTVTPGEIITRTIEGGNAQSDIASVA